MGEVSIHDQQHNFATDVGSLLLAAAATCKKYGLRMATGECWRSEYEAARHAAAGTGIAKSLHRSRLALDLILKAEDALGRWQILRGDHPAWRELGIFWKSLRVNNRWGGSRRIFPEGDFDRLNDAGHFSSSRGGVM